MEYQPQSNRAGSFLTMEDISRMDRQIFMPAIVRCDQQGLRGDKGIYYKNLSEAALIEDDIEFHPRFYSEMDEQSGACKHHVVRDCIETRTFDQLTIDERQVIRLRFQEQYREEGGDMMALSDDEEWRALNADDGYEKIKVRFIETTEYIFADTKAMRDYYIIYTLTIDDEPPRVLDEYSMDMASFDNTTASMTIAFSPEETAILDLSHEDICNVTTADLTQVMEIMTSLGLVTWKDQKRFVSGV